MVNTFVTPKQVAADLDAFAKEHRRMLIEEEGLTPKQADAVLLAGLMLGAMSLGFPSLVNDMETIDRITKHGLGKGAE